MKNILIITLMMSCLCSCSQTQDFAGEYEKLSQSGSVQYELKLHPNGTFHFESYSVRQMDGNNLSIDRNLPNAASISGKGTWKARNNIIYFRTDPDTDKDYKYTLNFNDTKAKFLVNSRSDLSYEIATIEFFDAGIFWIEGLELNKRN